MTGSSPSDRPLPGRQREARSNDVAVLASAREVFSERGLEASVADVARHAGVGVASIYRRYATKEALIEALHVHAVQEAAGLARSIVIEIDADADPQPGAVASFLARQITGASGPLLRPRRRDVPIPAALAEVSEELRVALERLIAHDHARGALPAGFTAADAMQLMQHLRPSLPLPRAEADALHLRYLGLVVQGLRTRAASGESFSGGPGWNDWLGAWHR